MPRDWTWKETYRQRRRRKRLQKQLELQPPPLVFTATPLEHHWFYQVRQPDAKLEERWKPFSMIDSMAIEDIFGINAESKEVVAADGGRYDVSLAERTKTAVYWKEEPISIRRCSWFYK